MKRLALILTVAVYSVLRGYRADADAPQWIVATAPAFRSAIEPLCDHRRADGMEVQVISTTDAPEAAQIRVTIDRLRRDRKGPTYVLLVGAMNAASGADAQTVVPGFAGSEGRMKGVPTDHGYGCPDDKLMPAIAVGRFPARTAKEASAMVEKTLAFERERAGGAWRNRLTVLLGNPGGATPLEKRAAELFGPSQVLDRLARLDSKWTARFVVHAAGSPYCVADDELHDVSLGYLREGQFWTIYLGHSGAQGLWSSGVRFVNRQDWGELKTPQGPGLLFTCGCFACQVSGPDGEGYALAAARNPTGPVAVIGAAAESYSTAGLLAYDGLLGRMRAGEPPRLADYWLAIENAILRGPIDPLTFLVLDTADGSHGQISLADQRREHAQMWTLLGDPALRMPPPASPIELKATGAAVAGGKLVIEGRLPQDCRAAQVRVTLERPLASQPGGNTTPDGQATDRESLLASHRQANTWELDSQTATVHRGKFSAEMALPKHVAWPAVIARAVAESPDEFAQGTLKLPVAK
jgi:Peptidase family C25